MNSVWPSISLGEVCRLRSGYSFKSADWTSDGIPVIQIGNIRDGYFEWSNLKYVSSEVARSANRFETQFGDTLVGMTGYVGAVARIRESEKGFLVNQRVGRIEDINFDVIDGSFLYWALRSTEVKKDMERLAYGSAQANLSAGEFAKIRIILPPLADQRRIARVLDNLDDLIVVNQGLINDFDEALVASWDIAARSTSNMKTVGEVAELSKGISYKGAFLTELGLPMINMGSFGVDGNYREAGLKHYVESEVTAKTRLSKGDLVIVNTDLTQSRDILARPVIVPYERATSTHHTYQVRVPGGEAHRFWLYCALRKESVRQRLISYSTGTTVAALPSDALVTQEIPWAENKVISLWWSHAETYYASHLALQEENKELSNTQGDLLPLLLNGRVRVTDGLSA